MTYKTTGDHNDLQYFIESTVNEKTKTKNERYMIKKNLKIKI